MSKPRRAADEHFAEFVRANTAALLKTGYLLTRDGGEAEELVQDTLVWLYPRWHQVQAAEQQIAYVRKAVVNRFLAGKRRMSSTEIRFDPTLERFTEQPEQRDEAAEVDERMAIWQELGALSDRQRAAMVLRFFHDLPDDEVAGVLGVPGRHGPQLDQPVAVDVARPRHLRRRRHRLDLPTGRGQ